MENLEVIEQELRGRLIDSEQIRIAVKHHPEVIAILRKYLDDLEKGAGNGKK